MRDWILSAIGDEIDVDIHRQTAVLLKCGYRYFELRKVDNKYLHEFELDQLRNMSQHIKNVGLKVITIDSPIGKRHMEDLDIWELFVKYVTVCKTFGAAYLRIFSDLSARDTFVSYCSMLNRMENYVRHTSIILLIENEKGTFGEDPEACFRLINKSIHSNVKFLFDVENCYSCNHDIINTYQMHKDNIAYLHLRDYSESKSCYEFLGDGHLELHKLLSMLYANKYSGVISLESHLAKNTWPIHNTELFMTSSQKFFAMINKLSPNNQGT